MTTTPVTTIKSALRWAHEVLKDTASIREARILLSEILGVQQEYLLLYSERALTVEQVGEFNRLVTERAQGKPLAYLLQKQAFYDIEVLVTPDVLIPRPETELLVEKAIQWGKDREIHIVDVGTGSGIIALTLAKHLPTVKITAVELSEAALNVARKNAEHLKLSGRISWLHGDLLQPLIDRDLQVDLIAANLPYIASHELKTLETARHEPLIALDGGADGLDLIRRLLEQTPRVLKSGGIVMMEIGANQGQSIRVMLETQFADLQVVSIEPDLAGHDRVVTIRYR